jgi:regulator of PEP synthase PpsR (kinase-PPPase family)
MPVLVHMTLLHLHLLSDSTGETLEMIASGAGAVRRRRGDPTLLADGPLAAPSRRIVEDLAANPGSCCTRWSTTRHGAGSRSAQAGPAARCPLDSVTGALEDRFGVEAKARPGASMMDEAYFARVDAIQFTIAHDDGIAWEDWEQADILLAGVSRSSKTPTSIYLANRGFKVANIPLVMESPPPALLFQLTRPMVVGLTTAAAAGRDRRNRLLSLNEARDGLCRRGTRRAGSGLCPAPVRG